MNSETRPQPHATPWFVLNPKAEPVEAEIRVQIVDVRDRYDDARHVINRRLFGAFTNLLEKYLANNPHTTFDHPKNRARPLVYMAPGIRSWAEYMPGGFATYAVHRPEVRRLHNGKRIDYITKQLFLHSVDAIGLRSRAYAMQWQIVEAARELPTELKWLSLACGSGQPAYDAIAALAGEHTVQLTLADLDLDMLAFAKENAETNKLGDLLITAQQCDVTDETAVDAVVPSQSFHVIDAMGLFEYLPGALASRLLEQLYRGLAPNGVLVFTNMLPSHPQLSLHKRGLGWPGVIPRKTDEVVSILRKAHVPLSRVIAVQPSDQVNNVYVVRNKDIVKPCWEGISQPARNGSLVEIDQLEQGFDIQLEPV